MLIEDAQHAVEMGLSKHGRYACRWDVVQISTATVHVGRMWLNKHRHEACGDQPTCWAPIEPVGEHMGLHMWGAQL